ncbi:MAG: lamin tail domain-containing protein [Saprospirales bacterium]|nr:lamin tail domain-containing protein [Saprospirales bacterium]
MLTLLLTIPPSAYAQIQDVFSDGDISANPAWLGDLNEFVVNAAGELQLNAPDAGASILAVEGNIPDTAVWLLDVRLEFAPSASNFLRIYLLADQPDLLLANGYYLEIGENGTDDALRLYRQEGPASSLLGTGPAGFVANEPVNIRLQVKRDASGNWQMDAASGAGAFMPQLAVNDATYAGGPGRYFGIYCWYTATRKDKFFFDNLSILPNLPDTTPPLLLSAAALNGTEITALFSEDLDSVSARSSSHYTISGAGQPASVQFDGGSRKRVRLSYANPMNTGTYILQTDQIADTAGNISGVQTTGFSFLKIEVAGPFDILINEIMADPSPSVGLPDVEWLELYNRSGKIIDLSTLMVSDGGAPQTLPAYLLHPDSFVVLASTSAAPLLAAVTPRVLAAPAFPSLNNDGDPLALTGLGGLVIDRVNYSSSWHNSPDKRDGGWTLERINPYLPCLDAINWQSCPALPGGTPGRENASLQTDPDMEAPRLTAAFPETDASVRLHFSEGLDQATVGAPASYRFFPARQVLAAVPLPNEWHIVTLALEEPLEPGVLYALSCTDILQDCSGNMVLESDTVYLGLPEVPDPQDIVVNEVLFNPETGGSDFVELYNRSNKIFNWQHFFLANFSMSPDVEAIGLDRLFLPGHYAVFSPDVTDIQARFPAVQPLHLLSQPLPSLPDDEGNIALFWSRDGQTVMVDSFDYSAGLHNALLSSSDQDGVSLERIRADEPTNLPANWTSAARSAFGSGTPTLPNSQRLPSGDLADGLIEIDPPRFSPDMDGYEDYLDIRYHLPGAGYFATLTIFDSDGIPVRRLVRQELTGTNGALRWDGEMDDGVAARPGIYIVFMEIFDPNGTVRQAKKPVALVKRF